MKPLVLIFASLLFFVVTSTGVFADETAIATSTPPIEDISDENHSTETLSIENQEATSTEEVVPTEQATSTEGQTNEATTSPKGETFSLFSEESATPAPEEVTETNCWQDDNLDTWCSYSDGSTALKQNNPFFTQLATYDQTSNFLSITASLNGTTIQANGPNYVSVNEPVQLTISFARSREDETFAPYQGTPLSFDDVIQNAGSSYYDQGSIFVFFKGTPGNATWITETYSPFQSAEGTSREITFTEPGHYFLVATPLYTPGKQVPGHDTNQFNYIHFLQFLSTGVAHQGSISGVGLTDPLLYGILEFDVLDTDQSPKVSNVLFLPGIKGSKLWMASGCDFLLWIDCDEEPLWPPGGHQDIQDLFLDEEGNTLNQIYTKEGQVVDTAYGVDFYKSFLDFLENLKESGTINAYEAVPYDWRLSIEDLITKGAEHDGKIFYEEATSTPYIKQELQKLAKTSQTGKVTVVAHSNGGLVAKALFATMGDTETSNLVDKIIFVGVPQSGAPQAIGALLFGYGEALPKDDCSSWGIFGYFCSLFTSRDLARTLAENSTMAYQLLPSFSYFDDVQDTDHPVGKFSGTHAYGQDFALYGDTIDTYEELSRFLRADDATRIKPSANDSIHPNILNSLLLNYADDVHHHLLDYWVPPSSVKVYELAGWGVDTISGIDFTEVPAPYIEYLPLYRPMFIEDGDGVVPVPSALLIPTSDNVKRFWFDLKKLKETMNEDGRHSNLFTLENVHIFVKNILQNINPLSEFITIEQPPTSNESKKLRFILYAQADFEVLDASNNKTGTNEDGTIDISIPNSNYDEFGSTKIITVPVVGGMYTVQTKEKGIKENTTLDIETVESGKTTHRSTVTNIPLDSNQTISFTIDDETGTTTPVTLETEEASSTPLVSFVDDTTTLYGPVATTTATTTNEPSSEETPNETPVSGSSSGTVTVQENEEDKIDVTPTEPSQHSMFSTQDESLNDEGHFSKSSVEIVRSTREDSKRGKAIPSTQTASVYDAFVQVQNWLTELLYTVLSFFLYLIHTFLNI